MNLSPGQEAFATDYAAGRNQVVWTELVADMDTVVSMMLKLTAAETHSFMLESVTGGEVRGRYSMVGGKPDLIWRCRGKGRLMPTIHAVGTALSFAFRW